LRKPNVHWRDSAFPIADAGYLNLGGSERHTADAQVKI
jgi:hypothetical protein